MKLYEKQKLNTLETKLIKSSLRERLNIRTIAECIFVVKKEQNKCLLYTTTSTGLALTISIPLDQDTKKTYKEIDTILKELRKEKYDTREIY